MGAPFKLKAPLLNSSVHNLINGGGDGGGGGGGSGGEGGRGGGGGGGIEGAADAV